MSFLSPVFFLGFAAIIGPVLIHLNRKEDSQKVAFSSLMFVKEITARTWRRKTLQNWPLFLLRVASLVFLAIGFARPYLTSWSTPSLLTINSKTIVALLDNSFSLRYGDHFEVGRQIVASMIKNLSGSEKMQIALFSDIVQPLSPSTGNPVELMSLLSGVRPGYRKSDYKAALKSALQLVPDSATPETEIHLISDFQETGWTQGSEFAIDKAVKIIPHTVCKPAIVNSSAQSPGFELQAENEGRFSCQVVSYGKTNPRKGTLSLVLNGKIAQEKMILLGTQEFQTVEFDHVGIPPGISTGQFKMDSDDLLPEDDICYFRVSNQKRYKVLLISDRAAPSNVYLSNALTIGSNSPFQVDLSNPAKMGTVDLFDYAAVVLNGVSSIQSTLSSALRTYVQQGGKLILILGPATNAGQINEALSGISPAILFRAHSSAEEHMSWKIGKIQTDHQIFEVFRGIDLSQLRSASISGFIESRPEEGSQVLVTLEQGYPLLIEKHINSGTCMFFCTSMNIDWSDLPLSPVFLPFVQQVARHLVSYIEDKTAYSVGESVPLLALTPRLPKKTGKLVSPVSSFTQPWRILKPSGEPIEFQNTSLSPHQFVIPEERGIYRSEARNIENAIAVNTDPKESNLECFDPAMRLASVRNESSWETGKASTHGADQTDRLRIESTQSLWRFFIVAVLVVLFMETFVAKRYQGESNRPFPATRG